MRKTIARLNIAHFRKLLTNEIGQTKRATLLRLLAEEKAKLADLESKSSEKRRVLDLLRPLRKIPELIGHRLPTVFMRVIASRR